MLKLYQLFDELQGHESNVAETLRELSGSPIALVISFEPSVPNPSILDPLKSVVPPVQPSLPILSTQSYHIDGTFDSEVMDSELRF